MYTDTHFVDLVNPHGLTDVGEIPGNRDDRIIVLNQSLTRDTPSTENPPTWLFAALMLNL